MRFKTHTLIIILSFFTLFACKNEKSKVIKEQATSSQKRMVLNIAGMTCQIGCARTIQSKLSKKEGIITAKIIFEKKLGLVEYDANKISKEEVTIFITKIAGGDLYAVTGSEEVASFESFLAE